MGSFLQNTVSKRNWVYPLQVQGPLNTMRGWIGWILIVIMVVIPVIRIQGKPLILFDIPGRQFVIFGTTFWPHDVWLLFFLIAGAAIALLFFTALYGRVWCGYACPQTVFLHHVFFKIERLVEGDRGVRQRRDAGPATFEKVWRKVLKHALFLVFSSFVAHVFLAYFIDYKELLYAIRHPDWAYQTPILVATIITAAFYIDFTFLREQFCTFLCPYARFQSALMDQDSLIITYDPARGEPRGKRKKGVETPAGDCVDCKKCVLVCPQGIDIRDGLQLDCIHCGLCVDACNPIMEKTGRPPGLIRYASENELAGKVVKKLRGRTVIYAALLVALTAGLVYELRTRRLVEASIVRPAGPLMQKNAVGQYTNHFRLQLVNKDDKVRHVFVAPLDGETFAVVTPRNPIALPAGSLFSAEIFLVARSAQASPDGEMPFTLRLTPGQDEKALMIEGRMIVPRQ